MMDSITNRALDRLFDVTVVLGDLMNARLSQHGLTTQRAEVLWVLYGQGPLTQRELSEILKCTPRNVTGLIDALSAASLVNRSPHPHDRRAVQVSLAEQGLALLNEWNTDRTAGATEALDGIAPADLATFTEVLERVLVNLRRSYPSA